MTEEKRQSLHPISEALARVYNKLYEIKEVKFPIFDSHLEKLDTIAKTVDGIYYGNELYPTLKLKASAYFCFIIKNHPVTDGNKRLSVIWLDIFCNAANLIINLPRNMTLDKLAVSVEAEKDMEMHYLIEVIAVILFDGSNLTVEEV